MLVAIIGGPCAGKTTVIEMLRKKGFSVVDEVSRQLIIEATVPAPWVNRPVFQQEVLRRQLLAEEKVLHQPTICFLDGGVFDGVAYSICDGLPVADSYQTIDAARYHCAFLFAGLPEYIDDGVRYQGVEFIGKITPLLEQCYAERGVKVVPIPYLPPEQRLNLILEELGLL